MRPFPGLESDQLYIVEDPVVTVMHPPGAAVPQLHKFSLHWTSNTVLCSSTDCTPARSNCHVSRCSDSERRNRRMMNKSEVIIPVVTDVWQLMCGVLTFIFIPGPLCILDQLLPPSHGNGWIWAQSSENFEFSFHLREKAPGKMSNWTLLNKDGQMIWLISFLWPLVFWNMIPAGGFLQYQILRNMMRRCKFGGRYRFKDYCTWWYKNSTWITELNSRDSLRTAKL